MARVRLLCLLLLCVASAARAEAAFALGRYADAAVLYERVFELRPQPALLYNAAQAHRLAGNKERALLLYQNYLRVYKQVPNRAEVEGHIAALQQAISAEASTKTAPPISTTKPTLTAPAPPPAPESPARSTPPSTTSHPAFAATPSSTEPPRRTWLWALVGVGAAVVVAAVIIGVIFATAPRDPTPSSGVFTFGGM